MDLYISETDYVVSSETIDSLQSQLTRLGAGISRTVYDLGDGTVLKIQKGGNEYAGGNLSEFAAWQAIKGTEWEIHFAECIAVSDDGSWLIQRAIDETFAQRTDEWNIWWQEIGEEIGTTLGIGDLHYGNVGTTVQGDIKIIDYAWSGYIDMGWLVSQASKAQTSEPCECSVCNPCECGDCECIRCYPEGCECEPLQGCHAQECEPCLQREWRNRKFVPAVAFVLSVAVCEGHNVKRAAWDLEQRNFEREHEGQGNLFRGFRIRSFDPD